MSSITRRTLLHLATLLVAALVLAACGGDEPKAGSTKPDADKPSAAERDWAKQRGEDWDTYLAAFMASWDIGCANTVRLGGSTELTSKEGVVTYADCTKAKREPTVEEWPDELPEDPEAFGAEDGELIACETVFDTLALEVGSDGPLMVGDQEFTISNCPAEGDGKPPTAAEVKAAPKSPGRVVDCPAFDLDGAIGASGFGFSGVSVRNMSCKEVTQILVAHIASSAFKDATLPGGLECEETAHTDYQPAFIPPPEPKEEEEDEKDADSDADKDADADEEPKPKPKPKPRPKPRPEVKESTSYRCANETADPPIAIRFTLG